MLALLIALGGVAAATLIADRLISRPIGYITAIMSHLAEGDLDIELGSPERRDEIGDMSKAVEVFRENAIAKDRAQQALRTSEANYRAIFNAANDGIFVHDLETGAIIDVNERTCELFGYRPEELRQLSIAELSAGDLPYSQDEALEWITTASGRGSQLLEWLARDKMGNEFWTEVNLRRVTIGDAHRLLAVVRDITARKRMQGEIIEAQRMETVGRLAGGISHQFNNALTALGGYARFARESLPEGDPARSDIDTVLKMADRLSDLTRRLLAFSRRQFIQPQESSLNSLVKGLAQTVATLSGDQVAREYDLDPDLWLIHVDPIQIEQVLLNTVVNAGEAMPDGGKLTIRTANVTLKRGQLDAKSAIPPGDFVQLTVTDTGSGMDDETLSHIFEPFFTTKGFAQSNRAWPLGSLRHHQTAWRGYLG